MKIFSHGSRVVVWALLCLPVVHLPAGDYTVGAYKVSVDEKAGLYKVSTESLLLLEQIPYRSSVPSVLSAGPLEVAQDPAHGVVTATRLCPPIVLEEKFEAAGATGLKIAHRVKSTVADKAVMLMDNQWNHLEFSCRIPMIPFQNNPFYFTTIRVKEVQPYTSREPYSFTENLKDEKTKPFNRQVYIKEFGMETASEAFIVKVRTESKNPFDPLRRSFLGSGYVEWQLMQKPKPPLDELRLKWGDPLDVLTVYDYIVEIEMKKK